MMLAASFAISSGISQLMLMMEPNMAWSWVSSAVRRGFRFSSSGFTGSLHTRLVVKGEFDLLFPVGLCVIRKIETDMAIAQWG